MHFHGSIMLLLLLLVLAGCRPALNQASATPRRTPFPLTQQLQPGSAYVVLFSPRNHAHFTECGDVTLAFEVVGADMSPGAARPLSALVHVGDTPTPVPLSVGVNSLTVRLTTPGEHPIRVTVLGPERTPEQGLAPARIRISCGARPTAPRARAQAGVLSAPCVLSNLRVWEATIRGDGRNPLPPAAFAAEHLLAPEDASCMPENKTEGTEFADGAELLFGSGRLESDSHASGPARTQRQDEAKRKLMAAAKAHDFNAPALVALLWGARLDESAAEAPDAEKTAAGEQLFADIETIRECVRVTAGEGGWVGHPLCHMALGFRLWKGIGVAADVGAAALHYKYAAQLSMRSVDPIGGGGGDVVGGQRRRGGGSSRLFEAAEQERVRDDSLGDYRAVAAAQGAGGSLRRPVRSVGGLDTGDRMAALERVFVQCVMGFSQAIPRSMKRGREAVEMAAEEGAVDGPVGDAGERRTRALVNLGVMALYGLGGDGDRDGHGWPAAEALTAAAAAGDPDARVLRAGCLKYGVCGDVKVDVGAARAELEAAALADHVAAQAALGALLRTGAWGVELDFARARQMLDRSAHRGNVAAVWHLGLMALGGEGVLPQCREAVRAFKHVAERSIWFNMLHAAEAAQAAGDMLGAYWRYRLAAQAGSRVGLSNLGALLERGVAPVIAANATLAYEAYRLAAEQGDLPAQRRMGDLCYSGRGCPRNATLALALYEGNTEDAQSLFHAAWMVELGIGSHGPDMARARALYEASAAMAARPARRAEHALPSPLGYMPARLALWRLDVLAALGCNGPVLSAQTFELLEEVVRAHFTSTHTRP